MIHSGLVAIGYARTSGAINPETSIPNQVSMIRTYCKQQNLLLKQVFVDEKKSGMYTDNRLEYQKLKEIVLQGKVDVVVVAFSDRLARESFEFVLFMQQMKRHSVDFISIQEDLKGSRMSDMEISMIASKNEMENRARSRRTVDGKLRATANGKYIFPKYPFGYRRTTEKKLEIVEEEAKIVRWIFDSYEKGVTMKEIQEHLITSHQQDRKWKFIGYVLDNALYTGERELPPQMEEHLPDVTVQVPAIISKVQFERVQKMRESIRRKAPYTYYLLSHGQFLCPHCMGKVKRKDGSYQCGKQGRRCFFYEGDDLDQKVLIFINDWITTQEMNISVTDQNEEILQQKTRIEHAFAIGKISYETFKANSQKIIQQYREKSGDMLITSIVGLQSLKLLISRKNYKGINNYLKENQMKLTLDSEGRVILLTEEQLS